jgi:putative ABC transport system substrate-binding protein
MRRREFISVIVGAAAWPLGARGQQGNGLKRVGVLIGLNSEDPEFRSLVTTFLQELARLGWVDGGKVRVEQRWTNADTMRANSFATELVALQPDVILTASTPATAALHRETTSVPVVFTMVSDPVGAGFIANLRRPGGNITGFMHTEATMGGKWLDLLKQIAPGIKRAAIMFNPDTAPGGGKFFLDSFEAAARSLAVEALTLPIHSVSEIETAVTALGRGQAGLVMMDESFMGVHAPAIIALTRTNNVPAIFPHLEFVRTGGLISYGADYRDIFRRAAGYADRILRGEKPADLPVQTPTKFETGVNLITAKALGLTVPPTLLATADEVIE